MNDIENILDLNASEIDELIQTLKEIEDLALSSEGLGQINMVIELFETNLDGLYKKAMVEQVKVRKQTFIEVIEELRDRRIRLERYREFLQTGAGVKVVQNQNYINVNPIDDIKNASDLELAIRTLIPKIQDDYDVIREADNEIDELEAIIASKLRQEPPADVSRERELISILNTNKGLFNDLDSSIPKALTNTSKMPEDFDGVNKLFRTDLDNYSTVWDSTTDYKIEEMFVDPLGPDLSTFDSSTSLNEFKDIIPEYKKDINIDNMPNLIREYTENNILKKDDIIISEDGFGMLNVPLNELLQKLPSPYDFSYIDKEYAKLLDRWRIYAIKDDSGNYTYSLLKYEEGGIAVSFVELDSDVINNITSAQNITELDSALHLIMTGLEVGEKTYLPFQYNNKGNEVLAEYFQNIDSQGSYIVVNEYIDYIVENYSNGNTINVNGSIIKVNDINNLTYDETNQILLATSGNSSVYSFAAENKYHADHYHMDAGVVTNAGKNEEEKSGVTDGYLKDDSKEVTNQKEHHGEKK